MKFEWGLQFGGARLLTSRLARTLAPPKMQTVPLPKSLDDSALCQYSSTIRLMNTKIFFPILCFSLSLPGAEPAQPGFRAVDIDTKIEIGYGVTVADVDGDHKPD